MITLKVTGALLEQGNAFSSSTNGSGNLRVSNGFINIPVYHNW